jgi:hypothetical protein
MYYRLELLVETWATRFYTSTDSRNNDNAGYDLYCAKFHIPGYDPKSFLIPQGVRARMIRVMPDTSHSSTHYTQTNSTEEEVHYFLAPRSSICKTPLQMANSMGIIDRSYRGPLMAPVRNVNPTSDYDIDEGTRLFQILAPDLGWIKEVRIVESLPETSRGEGGFGSTGK